MKGLSQGFRAWIAAHGLSVAELARDDVEGGSFGGCAEGAMPSKTPVVLVHGNSDRALGGPLGGWTSLREALLAGGRSDCEIYATTWGDADATKAALQDHGAARLMPVRRLLEAVLGYTGAAKVHVVSHSMGVTLARMAVHGGAAKNADGTSFDLGPALTSRVDAFVGIAGANRGLVACWQTGGSTPTCGKTAGLYPGQQVGPNVIGLSSVLADLAAAPHAEGARVYSLWSSADEVIGYGDVVWGEPTSRLPGQDGEVTSASASHLGLKDEVAAVLGWL